jgi:hypothetical protein
MRFGIRDIADVDEIRFFDHAERLGYVSVRVTDTTFLSRERHIVPEGRLSDTA